ncbi:MAG: prepilin-type N-terminal cleavage/methylation domain-containing protein, partial [bacterium]
MRNRPAILMRAARKSPRLRGSLGFTLLEVILSMGILALLAASIYAIASSSIGASRTAMDQQLTLRRLDAFLRVTRSAFLNLPSQGTVSLEIARGKGGEPEARLILEKAQGLFGMPSLGGGALVLTSKPRSDGTRTLSMIRVPSNLTDTEREQVLTSPGIPLLPKVRKPRWSFFQEGAWKEEWPKGSHRPTLVRLQLEIDDIPAPVEALFFVPPVAAPPAATQSETAAPFP